MKRFIPPKLKELIVKLLKSNSSTEEVADGLAIGVFVALLPIMGIQMYVSLLLTRLVRRNSIIAMIACWITNPLTFVPVYLFNLWVGNFLYKSPVSIAKVGRTLEAMDLRSLVHMGQDILIPLWLGSFIVGLIGALVSQRLCLAYYDRVRAFLHKTFSRDVKAVTETEKDQ